MYPEDGVLLFIIGLVMVGWVCLIIAWTNDSNAYTDWTKVNDSCYVKVHHAANDGPVTRKTYCEAKFQ